MRRFLVTAAAVLLLGCAVFLLFFTVTGYRSGSRGYLRSLGDFVFMVGSYNAQALALDPPALSERRYRRTMSHAVYGAAPEVRSRVVFTLARWGDVVVPRLLDELERPRSPERAAVALRALVDVGHDPGPELLERLLLLEMRPMESERLVDAMAELGPRTGPQLVAYYERLRAAGGTQGVHLLDAIGRSGGGAAFLLAEMEAARSAGDTERISRLLWPLAFTRDSRAARILVELLHHPTYDVRRRARDAMAQEMGAVAVAPAVEMLERETDDYVRSWILESLLARRDAAASDRVVPFVASLLDDPVLAWEANYALARIGNDEAIEVLRRRAAVDEPRRVMENLEYSGPAGLRVLQDYLQHEDRWVRAAALDKALEVSRSEAVPLLEEATRDSERAIRELARAELFRYDLLLLGKSFAAWLSRLTGAPPLPVGRLPAGTEIGPGVAMLSLVNWIGLGASLAVGLFLLCGWLRPFEHYKLALAIQFLLVLGIVGDFFFVRQPQHYPWVVAVRLLLLLGLLFLRDDPRPGETRGRIERLGLRSLWILVPLILLFGAPLFASALRFALRDFDFTKWALALLVLLAVLLVEQVALPWHLFTRGSRAERAMSFLLTAAVVALFVGALWWSPAETVGRSEGRRVVAVLVTLPLVVSLLFHLQESGLFTARAAKPELPPAPGRLRTFYDGESLIVRIRRRRRFAAGLPHLVAGGLLLTATWWLSHYVSGAAGLVVLLVLSLFGSALVAVLVLGLVPSYTVQVRNGAARSALVFLGGALGRAAWHRRIRLPALLDATPLGTLEKRWLSRVLDRTEAPPPAEVELSLRLVSSDEGTGVATELTVELEVRNLGETAVRLADLERAAGGPWSAEVAGRRADVHFGRADRERLVGAGDTARFRARLFPTGGASAEKGALLRCGALEARAEAT